MYFGSGMGAQRAEWVEAFAAEATTLQKEDHAQALLDVTKAFEMAVHGKLLDAAKRRRYPLNSLRMSIAAYRLNMTLGVDGIYSRTATATRGITAGSGFAMSELKVLLLLVMQDTKETCDDLMGLTFYVDD